ncbi:hypothetical protein CBOM_07720 [Ceraceosorus bombacis]|uniref:Uncharacterized protein n=1 Tax=Ceraceosorus bombacis TaxID=401625 RepID=A0A0P1BHH6_9BASI|nr:hypothetical protein CBOM_07720 [Ceraceosorus bombacis]
MACGAKKRSPRHPQRRRRSQSYMRTSRSGPLMAPCYISAVFDCVDWSAMAPRKSPTRAYVGDRANLMRVSMSLLRIAAGQRKMYMMSDQAKPRSSLGQMRAHSIAFLFKFDEETRTFLFHLDLDCVFNEDIYQLSALYFDLELRIATVVSGTQIHLARRRRSVDSSAASE